MHRTVDSIRLPLADMCSIFLMTSGGQKRAVKLGESYMAHRKILTSGSKRKHPNKQAGESVNRKGTWFQCTVTSGTRDTLRLTLCCFLLTHCFLTFGHPVCVCVYVCESVNLSLCQLVCSMISIIGITLSEFAPF